MSDAVSVTIRDVAYAVPETVVTNDDLRRLHPQWDLDRIEKRTGVRRRHVARECETALDLAQAATLRLFESHPGLHEQVDAILFCTESPDYPISAPMPACCTDAWNFLNTYSRWTSIWGCSGYPYCLALARGLIVAGTAKNVLVVNADTYSKFMASEDQAVRVLFGDAAAVSWISADCGGPEVVDIQCGTAGRHYEKFIVRAGGCRPIAEAEPAGKGPNTRPRPADKIQMDGASILAFTNVKIPPAINSLLARNGLAVQDVDLFLFHQASQMVLDSVCRLLRIRPERMFSNLADVGNTVSASIPMAYKDALRAGRIEPGKTLVLCGFGLGLSWGSVLLRWK